MHLDCDDDIAENNNIRKKSQYCCSPYSGTQLPEVLGDTLITIGSPDQSAVRRQLQVLASEIRRESNSAPAYRWMGLRGHIPNMLDMSGYRPTFKDSAKMFIWTAETKLKMKQILNAPTGFELSTSGLGTNNLSIRQTRSSVRMEKWFY
jgi:hypothetical protein